MPCTFKIVPRVETTARQQFHEMYSGDRLTKAEGLTVSATGVSTTILNIIYTFKMDAIAKLQKYMQTPEAKKKIKRGERQGLGTVH